MGKLLTSCQVVEQMRRIQKDEKDNAFAAKLGIAASYLNDIYSGRREPGPKVLQSLGLECVRLYRTVQP